MSRLADLMAVYEFAQRDPNARIPTYLAAAIENVRPVPPASPYAERRLQRRDDYELSVDGRQIRAGQ